MSEDITNKVKQTFVDSISVKQEIIDEESYKVLIEAGDIIANSISNGVRDYIASINCFSFSII